MGFHGTFPLPESQLDRFQLQISMDYPDAETELEILYDQGKNQQDIEIEPILSLDEVLQLQNSLDLVNVDRTVAKYLLDIVTQTRIDSRIELGCSPRGAISFFKAVKARAIIEGRDYVLPDDVQYLAPHALCHRIVLKGQHQVDRTQQADIVNELVQNIDVPV